jgi:hypothetical protein
MTPNQEEDQTQVRTRDRKSTRPQIKTIWAKKAYREESDAPMELSKQHARIAPMSRDSSDPDEMLQISDDVSIISGDPPKGAREKAQPQKGRQKARVMGPKSQT